jgi:predicted HTH transcriptional regulator
MMTTDELEARLEGGVETPALDVKEACDWHANSMAKDILAMSNLRDGGYIIVGVQDGTFERQGITTGQRDSYELDIMRDQMARFADPRVVFTVEFPKDKAGLEYAVIRVLPFDEVPVICAVDTATLKKGTIYYRNTNRRVESAAVSNAHDMRDIVTTATQRMMLRLREAGFGIIGSESDSDRARKAFESEREGL